MPDRTVVGVAIVVPSYDDPLNDPVRVGTSSRRLDPIMMLSEVLLKGVRVPPRRTAYWRRASRADRAVE